MKKTVRGFTLVELLVVIAIIAILAAVVVLIVNPLELTRRSRDAARMTDLANLQQAINVAVQESTNSSSYITCDGDSSCPSRNSLTGTRSVDGSGWVAVDLTASQRSVSVPILPVDPLNTTEQHYTYCGDGDDWMIVANLESVQLAPKETTDGINDAYYQVGSDMDMTCTY